MAKYKRYKDGYFTARVWDGTYVNGVKHYTMIRSKQSSRDLEQKVYEYKKSIEQGYFTKKSNYTVQEYAREWLRLTSGTRERGTVLMYENCVEKHMNDLYMPLAELSQPVIQAVINEKSDRPRICEIFVLTLKQVVKLAEKEKLLPKGSVTELFDGIKLPKKQRREKRPLTQEEKSAIKTADFTPRERLFITLLYCTGIRREEALALTRFDVSLKDMTLTINKAVAFDGNDPYVKGPKSKNGYRTIPIPQTLADLISEAPQGYLVPAPDGGPLTHSMYSRMWESIKKKMTAAYLAQADNPVIVDWDKVGFKDLTAHIFRHNYCTTLCYASLNDRSITTKKIAALLGDSEKMVLDVYGHIIEERENTQETISKAFAL